ncbi:MAG TPA: GNAT family N-acetyltransferase [Spirochaetales bacterium]|nr:GNAT family N-acetyltransferase [Spirochaetales bacterium]
MEGPHFEFRPVTRADKAAVNALCSKIWGGEDYLPGCFDSWVADERGRFTACVLDGRVIGLGKLSFLAPGHAWLEGLRKDPDVQVKGVGKAMCLEQLRVLAGLPGIRSVRFSAYAHNPPTIALNESLGFKRVDTYTVKSKVLRGGQGRAFGRALKEPSPRGFSLRPAAADAVMERFKKAGWFRRYRLEAWKAYPLDACPALRPDDTVLEAVDQAGASVGAIAWALDTLKRQVSILALSADAPTVAAALCHAAESAGRDAGLYSMEAIVPLDRALCGMFDKAGYRSWETEEDFLVYEYPLAELARHAT